jgi:hypothetical protein
MAAMSFGSAFGLTFLVVAAALLLSVVAGWISRPGWLPTRALAPIIVVLILVSALFGALQIINQQSSADKVTGHASPPENPAAAPAGPGGGGNAPAAREPSIDKKGYVLRRSSSIATNNQDKVDLDTGCPGWGGMHPRFGPSRCGETADLILDQEGIHPADDRPRFIEIGHDSPGGYAECRSALAAKPSRSVNQLEATALRSGERFCAQTDLDNTALVTVDDVATDAFHRLQQLTIDFAVWRDN